MPALIDVIIPVFNGAAYLREAVASIQNQTVADLRILIVDDGSTDETPAILASIAAQDARIEVLTTPNRGIVEALNLALERTSAPHVARQDADDIAWPDRFAVQLACFERSPGCVAQSGAVRHIDEAGRSLGVFKRLPSPAIGDALYVPAIEPYLIHPFLMARRAALLKAGGYRHVLHSEDSDLYWRLREQGELINLDRVLGDYRLHAASISGGSVANGRIMALSSQLSAMSYLRRRDGKTDILFEEAEASRLKAEAASLQQLYDLARPKLDLGEQARLKIALSAKMLELTSYRPYELALSDCEFLHAAAAEGLRDVRRANRRVLMKSYSGAAARLMHKGLHREAQALIWPALMIPTLYRFLLRLLFPPAFRALVKRWLSPLTETSRAMRAKLRGRVGVGSA